MYYDDNNHDKMLRKEASSTIFLSLWYDSTWDGTPVSRAIGEHLTARPMNQDNNYNNNDNIWKYYQAKVGWKKKMNMTAFKEF